MMGNDIRRAANLALFASIAARSAFGAELPYIPTRRKAVKKSLSALELKRKNKRIAQKKARARNRNS